MIIISWAYLARRLLLLLSVERVSLACTWRFFFQHFISSLLPNSKHEKILLKISCEKKLHSYWRSIIYDNFLLTRTSKHISIQRMSESTSYKGIQFLTFFLFFYHIRLLDILNVACKLTIVLISRTNIEKFSMEKQIFNERRRLLMKYNDRRDMHVGGLGVPSSNNFSFTSGILRNSVLFSNNNEMMWYLLETNIIIVIVVIIIMNHDRNNFEIIILITIVLFIIPPSCPAVASIEALKKPKTRLLFRFVWLEQDKPRRWHLHIAEWDETWNLCWYPWKISELGKRAKIKTHKLFSVYDLVQIEFMFSMFDINFCYPNTKLHLN